MKTEAEIVAEKKPAEEIAIKDRPAPDTSLGNITDYTPLYNEFGVLKPTPSIGEAMQKIWDYAKEVAPTKDRNAVMHEVIKLKNRLGSHSISEKPWAKVLNYVTIWHRQNQAKRQLKELDEIAKGKK